jgi:hypothetical protein
MDEQTVHITYRHSTRLGDDFVSVELAIGIRPGATDDEIAQTLETAAQGYPPVQEFVEARIAETRAKARGSNGNGSGNGIAIKDPGAPATDRQWQKIGALAEELGQAPEALLRDLGYDPASLTKGQASEAIDALKAMAETAGAADTPGSEPGPAPRGGPGQEAVALARGYIIPLGKNQGKPLGEASPQALAWYAQEFNPTTEKGRELQAQARVLVAAQVVS